MQVRDGIRDNGQLAHTQSRKNGLNVRLLRHGAFTYARKWDESNVTTDEMGARLKKVSNGNEVGW
jgi:hypothetical protein